jgi:PhoPQ-activated pathogenicity-related protein
MKYHNLKQHFNASWPSDNFDFHEVLPNYLRFEDGAYRYEFVTATYDKISEVYVENYILYSQYWPVTEKYNNLWKHQLFIYKPHSINYKTALIYVNGGYTTSKDGEANFTEPKLQEKLSLSSIANKNKAVVIDVHNVPNQYLQFQGEKFRKEDEILSYSYRKVLEDPIENCYFAGHLPMAKVIVKAMDAAQFLMKEKYDIGIEDFIAAGASKRGWAVWLAAIADERISAIIPIAIDILNVIENLKHIYASYRGKWPYALKDYEAEGVLEKLYSPEMAALMEIEDPFTYTHDDRYIERMLIPKLIINNSGDDFFPPDSYDNYFDRLPGNNNLMRYLPNSSHYFNTTIVSEAVGDYFGHILNCNVLPQIKCMVTANSIEVISSHKPVYSKLWFAQNAEERDFRFNKYQADNKIHGNIRYQEIMLAEAEYAGVSEFNIHTTLPATEQGWEAVFVELGYTILGSNFILTSGVTIIPDTYI